LKVIANTKNMTREDWLELRRQYIGGSDAPAIMGVSPYSTSFDIWLSKTGELDEDLNSEAMIWGTILEDTVAREWTNRTGIKLRKRHAMMGHDKHEFMAANIDRLVVGEDAGAEIKTTNAFYDGDECPEWYFCQIQHYLAVTGKPVWYLIVLAGGQKLYSYKIKRDDVYINDKLIPAEKDFWELVQTGTIPAVDGSEACSDMLKRLYSESNDEQIELPEDTYDALVKYDEAAAQEKDAKARKDLIANQIKAQMGEYSRAFVFDRKVHWTPITSSKFDSKTFSKDHPDLYEKYKKESQYRRFQIK